jgi:hypothetical protein
LIWLNIPAKFERKLLDTLLNLVIVLPTNGVKSVFTMNNAFSAEQAFGHFSERWKNEEADTVVWRGSFWIGDDIASRDHPDVVALHRHSG